MKTTRPRRPGRLTYRDGEHYRHDGHPVVLRVHPTGSSLRSIVSGRSVPVDALTLAVWTRFGRLVRHVPSRNSARSFGRDRRGSWTRRASKVG